MKISTTTPNISNIQKDFTLLYNPNWGYNRCSTKAYFQSIPDLTNFQHGYHGIEDSIIKGSFHLRYTTESPLYTNKIELIFEGKQFISWKEINENNNKNNENKNNYVSEEKVLYRQTKIIWESINGHYEKILSLDIPFEFSLPNDLPATITPLNVKGYGENIAGGIAGNGSEIGHITYSLRAQISRSINIFKLQMSHKKIIDVWCRIHKWYLPTYLDETIMKNVQQPFKWIRNSHDLNYEIELEKTLFDYKDTINISMKFDTKKVKIKKICAKIKEYHKLKVNGKSKMIGGFVVINSILGGQIRKSTYVKLQLNLTRTNLGRKLNCSTKNEMIDIWHKLKIRIFLESLVDSSSQFINLEKEISILNLVQKHDSPFLAQQNRLINTWFYHNDTSSSESVGSSNLSKKKLRFSWFGEMKDQDEHNHNVRKKRLSLFSGRNTH